jgi:hypothetical protein
MEMRFSGLETKWLKIFIL